jgi:hypothetical protein
VSGGRGEGDLMAEDLELVNQVAGPAVLVEGGAVVVSTEVVEASGWVGEQVPDNDQNGAGHCHEGPELASALYGPVLGSVSPAAN